MLLWLLHLCSLLSIVSANLPTGVPSYITCSMDATSTKQVFAIGNAYEQVLNIYVLDKKCQERPFRSIQPGFTLTSLQGYLGTQLYVRQVNTSAVIDTFVLTSTVSTWVIANRIPLDASLAKTPIATLPSIGTMPDPHTEGVVSTVDAGPSTPNNTTWIIVGVVMGLVVVVGILVTVLYLRHKRSKSLLLQRSPGLVAGKMYRIVREHISQLPDELTVQVGDIVQVHAIYDDGWINASVKKWPQQEKPTVELTVPGMQPKAGSSTDSLIASSPHSTHSSSQQGMLPAVCLHPHSLTVSLMARLSH